MDTERLFRITRIPSNIKIPDVWIDFDRMDVDHQFALAAALLSPDLVNIIGITATEDRATVEQLLALTGRTDLSDRIRSADEMLGEVHAHHRRNPVYFLALGSAERIARAVRQDPAIMGINAVIFWLAGHSFDHPHTHEPNLQADLEASRTLFDHELYLCQVPCKGMMEPLSTTEPELRAWIKGQNPLGDYLYDLACEGMPTDAPWSRILWSLGAAAALVSRESGKYAMSRMETTPILREDFLYGRDPGRHAMRYVYAVKRDAILGELFGRIRSMNGEKAEA